MAGIPDSLIIAVIMTVPTLLVYFGSRKKQRAETDDLVSSKWQKLSKAQDDFTGQMESRISALGVRVSDQDSIIATQNKTIADQNITIAGQTARIAEQDRIISEQKEIITDLTKQIEGMGGTPVHRRGGKSGK